ncbi:7842_t:CDS:1, partial [Racocetra persica]
EGNVEESTEQLNKKSKVDKAMTSNTNLIHTENIMYIPFMELSDKLDILKKIAGMEITINLGQLFKWSPKTHIEIMRALL